MNIGRNVMSMEDYLLAIQYFNLAIKTKPYLADAYFLRGLAKLQLDDYEGALADCNASIERNRFKSETYKVRGFALLNLNKDSLAIEDFKKGLEYNPNDKYFLYYKGIAESELNRFSDADSTFKILLRRNPKFEDGFVARARLNILRGDTIAAINDLDHSLQLSKSLLNAYLLKTEIETKRNNWSTALDNMNEAVRLRPEEADFYVNRAYLRYNNEDFFGAMADYNYALQIQPSNMAALFNRALLRSEVKELSNAENDFSEVLRIDPKNFYALYNRGLIRLELGDYRNALSDFLNIIERFPRFHPAYYAMAECQRQLGRIPDMVKNIKKGDELVANYIKNPTKNPLDRPTIAPGRSNSAVSSSDEETEEEFMERFNRLVTSERVIEPELSFNERIKGRVQDRNINIIPERSFSLTFLQPASNLRNVANYFRDLEILNQRQYLSQKIYLTNGNPAPENPDEITSIFALEDNFSNSLRKNTIPRPIDFLGRGITRTMLKNYDGAIEDFTLAIEGADDFTSALFSRAFALYMRAISNCSTSSDEEGRTELADSDLSMEKNKLRMDFQQAINDLDTLLRISPRMIYAWYNKGIIYYEIGDFTSAIQCFTKALEINPEFAEAYYNRGLSFLNQGNREKAFSDLSKAGELGVIPSYNILKRLK